MSQETQLLESEALTGAILESALDCIIAIDAKGRILEFNPAAERTFGYRRAEVVGPELAETIVPPSLRERHRAGMARYLATGEARVLGRRVEITGMRSDGSEFPVELAIKAIRLNGAPAFTAYLRDITQRKEAEKLLSDYNRTLERKVEERTEELSGANAELAKTLQHLRAVQHQMVMQAKMTTLGNLVLRYREGHRSGTYRQRIRARLHDEGFQSAPRDRPRQRVQHYSEAPRGDHGR